MPQSGEVLSQPDFRASDWYAATVPGTVLTSLVNNGVYPEPLYGENNHHIAESCFKALARALREAVEIDPRQKDRIPSTKGSLKG